MARRVAALYAVLCVLQTQCNRTNNTLSNGSTGRLSLPGVKAEDRTAGTVALLCSSQGTRPADSKSIWLSSPVLIHPLTGSGRSAYTVVDTTTAVGNAGIRTARPRTAEFSHKARAGGWVSPTEREACNRIGIAKAPDCVARSNPRRNMAWGLSAVWWESTRACISDE
jgi:hypothetical protein